MGFKISNQEVNYRRRYMQERYLKNKEAINKRQREYYYAHREEILQQRKLWYLENREEHIKKVLAARKRNRYSCGKLVSNVRYADYQDKMKDAKTGWEKVMIKKRYEQSRKAARTLLNKTARKHYLERKERKLATKKRKIQEAFERKQSQEQ